MDVDEILALPSTKLQEWMVFLKVEQEKIEEHRDIKSRENKTAQNKPGKLGQRPATIIR